MPWRKMLNNLTQYVAEPVASVGGQTFDIV